MQYSLTITRQLWNLQNQLKSPLQLATGMGGNIIKTSNFIGRKTGMRSINQYCGKDRQKIACLPGRCKVTSLHHLQDCHTQREIFYLHQLFCSFSFQEHHTLRKWNINKYAKTSVLPVTGGPGNLSHQHWGTFPVQPRPKKTIQANTPLDLPGSREYPIFYKPGSIFINSVEDLLKLYSNSFDMLGSLKGEYDIKVDPTVPPVQHARRKVPIESKATIKEAIDYMVSEGILKQQLNQHHGYHQWLILWSHQVK